MFDPDIKVQIAAMMTRSAYMTLADKDIDTEFARSIIDGHSKYIGTLSAVDQVAMRQAMIRQALPYANRLLVEKADTVRPQETRNIVQLVGPGYSVPIYRKVALATRVCAKASDAEEYFGIIEVSKRMVTIAMLPWLWGFTNWQWKFGERPPHSATRDYFMVMTGAEKMQRAAIKIIDLKHEIEDIARSVSA